MQSEPLRVTDPRTLRAIAHPVRARLLSELDARGASRAADLAAALSVPANSVSFHLRQLAKYGLVEEAPERARDKRDRWWQPASASGTSWDSSEIEAQPGGRAAVGVWRRVASGWAHQMVERFFTAPGESDRDSVRTSMEVTMRLTKDEATQLADELGHVFDRWSQHGREAEGAGSAGDRRTYLALIYLQPFPEDIPLSR